jgi:hypothetical protein
MIQQDSSFLDEAPPSQKREVRQYIPTKKYIFATLKPKNTG